MPLVVVNSSYTKSIRASFELHNRPALTDNHVAIAALIGGLMLASASSFAQDTGAAPHVTEPVTGRRTYTVPISLRPDTAGGWSDLTACTAYGTMEIKVGDGTTATPDTDVVLAKSDYSIPIQPYRNEQNQIVIDVASDEIIFEILSDDEFETPEMVTYGRKSYGITCDDGVDRSMNVAGADGSFIIGDALESQIPGATIPVRQKSLSAQLNSLRTLSLHNSITRDRSIAKEIDRARRNSGVRANNLRVRYQGQNLSTDALLGGAAGDSSQDFGRWGAFVTGNIDLGEQEKDSALESDFRSNMLIAGVDYKISDNAVLGAAITHSDMDAGSDETANTDFNRYSLSLFGSLYSSDAFYLDLMLTYGTSSYDLDRRITRDDGGADLGSADTDGDELSTSLGAGYNWHHRHINMRLFSFLNYIDANIEGYRESVSGASSAAVVDGMDLQSLIANLGVELSWNINTTAGVLTPMVSIAQERQYADDSVYVTGQLIGGQDEGGFAYSAPSRDDNYLNAQLGFSAVLKNGVSAFVSYDTFMDREDFASRQWSIGARWEY